MSGLHILAIPYPAQGHVIPLLELSQCLVKYGCRVTFVNSDYNHQRVVDALAENISLVDRIQFVSIPDGMKPSDDRNHIGKLTESMTRVMPGKIQELIENIVAKGDKIDCVVGDGSLGFVMQVAKKMNIRRAAFWTAATAILAFFFRIPQLISDGIIDNQGVVLKKEKIQLTPKMPATSSEHLAWACIMDSETQKIIFNSILNGVNEDVRLAQTMLCNSTYDLEPEAFNLVPEMLPVGPLLASNRLGTSAGSFWSEDETCLKWLDKQATNSVVYIAFGSFTVFDPIQFKELALGLALSNRPFLWAVRPYRDVTYPEGFQESLVSRGCVTGWVPQQRVLSHPSIACFISHCGWNPTMEGISNGVPFLCWHYFGDQFMDESYICDVWKVGLRLEKNENGIVTTDEIKCKLDRLLSDEDFRTRSLEIKAKTSTSLAEGGQSDNNFKKFINWIKG